MAYNKQDLIIILRAGDRYYDAVRTIKDATQAQRREAIDDGTIRSILKSYPKPQCATVIMATLLDGEQQWRALLGGTTEFYDFYITNRKNSYLSYSATMNCWEMILYAALVAGHITVQDIIKFYDNAFPAGSSFPGSTKPWEVLNWFKPLPYFPGFSITGGTTREPEPGDLLFFTQKGKGSPDHVAVSMGGRQAVSLSNRPYSTIQRVTVDQLYFNNSGDAYIQIGTSITQVIKRLYF
jgi:hypothetical protein